MTPTRGELQLPERSETSSGSLQGYMVFLTDEEEDAMKRIYARSRSSAEGHNSSMPDFIEDILRDFIQKTDVPNVPKKAS